MLEGQKGKMIQKFKKVFSKNRNRDAINPRPAGTITFNNTL
jgi:hypothetical protein